MTLENYSSRNRITIYYVKAVNQKDEIIDLSKYFIGANEVFRDDSVYFEKGKDLGLICRKTYKSAYYVKMSFKESDWQTDQIINLF
jgi:hypothetical protein